MGMFLTKRVRRNLTTSDGIQGSETVNRALIRDGKILRTFVGRIDPETGRQHFGADIEVDKGGYDRTIRTADMDMFDLIMGLKFGDVVDVDGILRKNPGGRGYQCRPESVYNIRRAPVVEAPSTADQAA